MEYIFVWLLIRYNRIPRNFFTTQILTLVVALKTAISFLFKFFLANREKNNFVFQKLIETIISLSKNDYHWIEPFCWVTTYTLNMNSCDGKIAWTHYNIDHIVVNILYLFGTCAVSLCVLVFINIHTQKCVAIEQHADRGWSTITRGYRLQNMSCDGFII